LGGEVLRYNAQMEGLALKHTGGNVVFTFHAAKLGCYLEPNDDYDRGAVVASFEPVDGAPGEAETSGLIKPGFTIVKVAGIECNMLPFLQIVALLIASPRPLEVHFLDTTTLQFLDRFGFPHPRLWCEKEANYLSACASDITKNELEWHDFLTKLGDGRGPGFGVLRLVRDANGGVVFPQDPSKRLNAMSPIHGRCEGISGSPSVAPASSKSSGGFFSSLFGGGSGGSKKKQEQLTQAEVDALAAAEAEAAARSAKPAGAGDDDGDDTPLPPVDIFKRCWNSGVPWSYYHPSTAGSASTSTTSSSSSSPWSQFPLLSFQQRKEVKDWTTSCLPTPPNEVIEGGIVVRPSTLPIGYHVPPGLGLPSSSLPGNPATPKQRQQLCDTLRRMTIYNRGGGFPQAFRARLWFELSGARALKALHPPRYYHRCLLARQAEASASGAISKDVPRTFPGHAFFAMPTITTTTTTAATGAGAASDGTTAPSTPATTTTTGGEGLASLTRVLTAFANHNHSIGYCQGLNSLAGWLLLWMPEEDAFWTLEALANEILPPSYFNDGLIGLFTDLQVFSHLLSEMLPEVARVVEESGIELHTVCLEWFMCIGCSVLPTNTALRLWDLVFVVGFDQAIFRLFLALFAINKTRILSLVASASQTSLELSATAVPPSPTTATNASPASSGTTGGSAEGGNSGKAIPPPPASPAAVQVHIRRAGGEAVGNDSSSKKGGIETRSKAAPGVGLDSLSLEKAVGAAMAAAALLTPDAASVQAGAASSSSTSSSPAVPASPSMSRVPSATATAGFHHHAAASSSSSSPAAGSSLSAGGAAATPAAAVVVVQPTFKGGTVRHGAQLFPALYNLLKTSLPSCNAAHDVDQLLRLAFPCNAKEEIKQAQLYGLQNPNSNDPSAFSWDTNLHPSRIAKLRQAAKQRLQGELEDHKRKAEARRQREVEAAEARKKKAAVAEAEAKATAAAAAAPSTPATAAPVERAASPATPVLTSAPEPVASAAPAVEADVPVSITAAVIERKEEEKMVDEEGTKEEEDNTPAVAPVPVVIVAAPTPNEAKEAVEEAGNTDAEEEDEESSDAVESEAAEVRADEDATEGKDEEDEE
jgi:Rab-GTPase-TBC domain